MNTKKILNGASLAALMAGAACQTTEKKPEHPSQEAAQVSAEKAVPDTANMTEQQKIQAITDRARAQDSVQRYNSENIHRYINFVATAINQSQRVTNRPGKNIGMIGTLLESMHGKPLPAHEAAAVLDSIQAIFKLDAFPRLSKGELTSHELGEMLATAGNTQMSPTLRSVIMNTYRNEIQKGEIPADRIDPGIKAMRQEARGILQQAGVKNVSPSSADGLAKLAIHIDVANHLKLDVRSEAPHP